VLILRSSNPGPRVSDVRFGSKSGHRGTTNQCLLYPQKRTLELGREMSAMCHSGHAQQADAPLALMFCADRVPHYGYMGWRGWR
jgi:hypothetical protein